MSQPSPTMSHTPQQLQEKSDHMLAQLQSTERLIIAHFAPTSRERQESQRLLHQVWALCFLGYNAGAVVPDPVPELVNPELFPDHTQDAAEAVTEKVAKAKVRSIKSAKPKKAKSKTRK